MKRNEDNAVVICQILKVLLHFEIFLNTGPHGAGKVKRYFFKFYSAVFIQFYPNDSEDNDNNVGIQPVPFLGNGQSFKKLHLLL